MAAHKPVGTGTSIGIGVASTYVEFKQESQYVRVVAVGEDCHVAIGTEPTAGATDYYVPSGGTAVLSLDKVRSNRVVGVTTGTGETTIDFAQGTGSPVDVGQLVMLDITGNSVLSFGPGVGVATANAAYVTSINSFGGQSGYESTRITVDFDSQDLAAAMPPTWSWAQLHKVARVAVINGSAGTGTAYIQQVQTAGDA